MQTAALVYRPPLPVPDEPASYIERQPAGSNFKILHMLVAGQCDVPVETLSDRFVRMTVHANAPDFQTVLSMLRDFPGIDLVMLDASLPGLETAADLRRICDRAAGTPVVVGCNKGEEKKAVEFLRSGATGVIPGGLSDNAIASAIQLILAGQRFAPVDLLMEPANPSSNLGALMDSLSNREREVARLIAEGCPNKEIACRLGLQEITIKVYASAVFRKLGVRNRTAAAARLLAEGL